MKKNDIVYFVCCVNEKEYAVRMVIISTKGSKIITDKGTYEKSKLSLTIPTVCGDELPIID